MTLMTIEYTLPDEKTCTCYLDQPLALLGRGPECDVKIPHPAIPRRLCRVFLEKGHLRLEEFPGLTNPLIASGKQPIHGGIAGPQLNLQVGPVALRLSKGERVQEAVDSADKMPRRRLSLFSIIGLLAICGLLAKAVAHDPGVDTSNQTVAAQLPESPLRPIDDTSCRKPANCLRRASLLQSRAEDLLDSAAPLPGETIAAASLLGRRARFLKEAGSPLAEAAGREATDLEASILAGYRLQRLALDRAVRRGDQDRASDAAKTLIHYLDHNDPAASRRLSRLVRKP